MVGILLMYGNVGHVVSFFGKFDVTVPSDSDSDKHRIWMSFVDGLDKELTNNLLFKDRLYV